GGVGNFLLPARGGGGGGPPPALPCQRLWGPPPPPPPPAPVPLGRRRAPPRAAPARRCGQQPGDTRGRTVWTGPAAAGGGRFQRGFYTHCKGEYTRKGVRDTSAARTSLRRLRQPNQTL